MLYTDLISVTVFIQELMKSYVLDYSFFALGITKSGYRFLFDVKSEGVFDISISNLWIV